METSPTPLLKAMSKRKGGSLKLQKGQLVTVYQRPYSRRNKEGVVILDEFDRTDIEGFEYWDVYFLEDINYNHLETFSRKVHPSDIIEL